MKKKASFWISGITTVAMLVTAVGSFAAWETLTGSTNSALNVTTSTPVTLGVSSTNETNQLKLRPDSATIFDNTKESTIVKVGTMNVQLKGTAKSKVSNIAIDSKVYKEEGMQTAATTGVYEVVIVAKGTANVSASTTSITASELATALIGVTEANESTGLDYDVYLKFKAGIDVNTLTADEQNAKKYVKVNLTASAS